MFLFVASTTFIKNGTHKVFSPHCISIGNYTVREVLMKNRTRVWRNVYNTASA